MLLLDWFFKPTYPQLGPQLGPQDGPKSLPKPTFLSMYFASSFLFDFSSISDPHQIPLVFLRFWTCGHMPFTSRFGGQHGPNLASQIGPRRLKIAFKIHLNFHMVLTSIFKPTWPQLGPQVGGSRGGRRSRFSSLSWLYVGFLHQVGSKPLQDLPKEPPGPIFD